MKRILSRILLTLVALVVLGMLIPQNLKMPVVGADSNSYNHETFWYEGWGTSIVHKGIDVFARRGTRVNSATTPAHLHYGIGTLIPYPWRIDDAPLGHQKAFYLNPIDYLEEK